MFQLNAQVYDYIRHVHKWMSPGTKLLRPFTWYTAAKTHDEPYNSCGVSIK